MEAEREAILKALAETNWNRKRAAKLLNISYKAILYKIRQYGLTQ
jgi:two-component system response regulator AtoC